MYKKLNHDYNAMANILISYFAWGAALLSPLAAEATGSLDLSNMPVSVCGWPSLHEGGKFPEWNTRLAQYLLEFALNESISVDGVFTSETTDEISRYQSLAGLPVNGYLNIDTWPSLTGEATPLNIGSSGPAVLALQDSLGANGFPAPLSGLFDAATAAALSTFQTARGATVTSGEVVDAQSWHLLTTQCNISMPGHYWFDAGWPQGSLSQATLECLRDSHFEYAVFECWRESSGGSFWGECIDNIANAWAAGFEYVDVYMYPERYRDPTEQANELLANLTANAVKFGSVMLDVEGSKWNEYSHEENQEFMLSLRAVFYQAGILMTMYCSSTWNTYFGSDFSAFQDMPLIYAHYDNVPSFYDYDYAPFGGWAKAAGKQFWDGVNDEVVCSISLDWDWSPEPFWKRRR